MDIDAGIRVLEKIGERRGGGSGLKICISKKKSPTMKSTAEQNAARATDFAKNGRTRRGSQTD